MFRKIFSNSISIKEDLIKLGDLPAGEIQQHCQSIGFKQFVGEILVELVKSIQNGNLEYLKCLGNLISQLPLIENKNILSLLLDNESSSLFNTNLIILTCKYNCKEILEYLLGSKCAILKNLTTDIGRIELNPCDKDDDNRTAFYYAIRSNTIEILELLIDKWQIAIENEIIDNLLSEAYRELKLHNVYLSDEMKFFIEHKLLKINFYSENFGGLRRPAVTLDDVKERCGLVIYSINILLSEYAKTSNVNEKFLFILKSLVININALKKQLKSTYDKIPWEEIHFSLFIFLHCFNSKHENTFFYRSFINKSKLLNYLKAFANSLKEVSHSLLKSDIMKNKKKNIGNLLRKDVISKISGANQVYKDLYDDYKKIRDFYSLERIREAIDVVLQNTLSNNEYEFLLVLRCIQVIGENTKNTLKSPNLSNEISSLLLLVLPADTNKITADLRDSLSKKYSIKRRNDMMASNKFYYVTLTSIKYDIKIMRKFIINTLYDWKSALLSKYIHELQTWQDYGDFLKICEVFQYGRLNVNTFYKDYLLDISAEKRKAAELIAEIFKDFNLNGEAKFKIPATLFKTISNTMKNYQKINYQSVGRYIDFFQMLNHTFCSYHLAEAAADKKLKHLKIKKFFRILVPNFSQCSNEKNKIQHNLQRKLTEIVAQKQKFFGQCDQKCQILLDVLTFIVFGLPQDNKSLRNLKMKLSPETKRSQKQLWNLEKYLPARKQLLQKVLSDYKLFNCIKEIKTFLNSPENRQVFMVIEMLLLEILSINDRKLNDTTYFLDDAFPLLLGKELRNQIAHGNPTFDVILLNNEFSIIVNAILYCRDGTRNTHAPPAITKSAPNLDGLEKRFNKELQAIDEKIRIFKQVEFGKSKNFNQNVNRFLFHAGSRDINDFTLLEIAAKTNPDNIFVALLRDYPIFDFDLQNNSDSLSVFHLAAMQGNHSLLEFLAETSPDAGRKFAIGRDYCAKTPLHHASTSGCLKTVKFLLSLNKNGYILEDNFRNRPIHAAIYSNNFEVFKILFACEIHPDKNRRSGQTLLQIAAQFGRLKFIEFLIQNGADVNDRRSQFGGLALLEAIANGHFKVAQDLIKKHSATVHLQTKTGSLPLNFAVENSDERMIKLLIENGVAVNCKENYTGNTPLIQACQQNSTKIATFLIRHEKINIACENNAGLTPLLIAVRNGNEELVTCLLRTKKVNINAKDKIDSSTPLHYAADLKDSNIFKILLNAGAKYDLPNSKSLTPLQKAFAANNFNVLEIVADHNLILNPIDYLELVAQSGNLKVFQHFYKLSVDISDDKKSDLFFTAIKSKAIEICDFLIESGVDVNKIMNGETPLLAASNVGYVELVELLIERKANVTQKISGQTIFDHYLRNCEEIDLELLKVLIKGGSDINSIVSQETPLVIATKMNRRDIVDCLIENNANVNICSPLITALMNRNSTIANILLEHPEINVDVYKDSESLCTLLHFAVGISDLSIIQKLIEKGCDVKKRDKNGWTALHFAMQHNQENVVEKLLQDEFGIDIDATNKDEKTALHLAIEGDLCGIIDILVKKGANLNLKHKFGTYLHFAVRYGLDSVSYFINQKIDINATNDDGETPLHIAAQLDFLSAAKLLIQKGAVHVEDKYGLQPIQIAAMSGSCEILEYFIGKSSLKVSEIVDANELTLLHYAARQSDNVVIDFLVKLGCNINATDSEGNTPLQVAAISSNVKICEYLIYLGAFYDCKNFQGLLPVDVSKNGTKEFLEFVDKLFKAVCTNRVTEFQALLQNNRIEKALKAKNVSGETLLYKAVLNGSENIILEILLNSNIDSNSVDIQLNSALHVSCNCNNSHMIKKILKKGAIYNSVNSYGQKPIDMAKDADIIMLFKLIDNCFRYIQKNDLSFFTYISIPTGFNETKIFLLRSKNINKECLLTTAIKGEFTEYKQLKVLFLGNYENEFNKAKNFEFQGEYHKSLAIYQRIHEKFDEILGPENPETLKIMSKIAFVKYKLFQYKESLSSSKKIFEKQNEIFGMKNKCVLKTRKLMATVLYKLGHFDESLKIFTEVVGFEKIIFQSDFHENVLKTELKMALVLMELNRFDEAVEINSKVLNQYKHCYDENDLKILDILNNNAEIFIKQNQFFKASELLDFIYEKQKIVFGSNHNLRTLKTLYNKAKILDGNGFYDDAIIEFTKLSKTLSQMLNPDHPFLLFVKFDLARIHSKHINFCTASEIVAEICEKFIEIFGNDHSHVKKINEIKFRSIVSRNFIQTGSHVLDLQF